MASDVFSQYCGRMFEVAFNTGLLTFLAQQERNRQLIMKGTIPLYRSDLAQLHLHSMTKFVIKESKTIGSSSTLLQVAEQILLHFACKGFIQGLHFLEEYLHTLDKQTVGEPYANKKIHVRYVQCDFRGENGMGAFPIDALADQQSQRQCLTQLEPDINSSQIKVDLYSETGRFLKADCLILLEWNDTPERSQKEETEPIGLKQKYRERLNPGGFVLSPSLLKKSSSHSASLKQPPKKHWRILCMDFSIHRLNPDRLRDPNFVQTLRKQMLGEVGYLRTRGVFSNLGYDITEEDLPETLFSGGLTGYLTAFKKRDKESAKLIQAGGYAYDFYDFLCGNGLITLDDDVVCHAFGISDRDINSMHVQRNHMNILQTCQHIYRYSHSEESIDSARDHVTASILEQAKWSFETDGHELFEYLSTLNPVEDGCIWLPPLTETIPTLSTKDFVPTSRIAPSLMTRLGGPQEAPFLTIQQAHTKLVREELSTRIPYVVLLASPGIGKTTATVEQCIEEYYRKGEGFLILYFCPRTQVNLDFMKKFCTDKGKGPLYESILALTTSADILDKFDGPTVLYSSANFKETMVMQGIGAKVTFIHSESPMAHEKLRNTRFDSLMEDLMRERAERKSGVLYSICQAIAANMKQPVSNQIVATVSIQSLKKKGRSTDTLDHLQKIFAYAYDSTRNRIIPERMQELARRIPHLIFMVDEVTGDESGVALLEGLHQFAETYELFSPSSPFHTKIVIADASIGNQNVIERHLESSSYEPEKIYVQYIADPSGVAPIAAETFTFRGLEASAINANTYPAHALEMSYHLCIECQQYDEQATQSPAKNHLTSALNARLAEDLVCLLQRPKIEVPQVIVYIQDKQRLTDLIKETTKKLGQLKSGQFKKNDDYLEIHASMSPADRMTVDDKETREKVRVIFMTASASRGLSFPDATYFLIDVPRFSIEANVMEILQVMYRGRGGHRDQDTKYVQFYLSDRVLYQETAEKARALRERILGIVDMLIILKTSIMTRINGAGRLRQQYFQMIPVGGKSVSSVGGTFPDRIAEHIHKLQDEARQHPDHPDLKRLSHYLQRLFGEGKFNWNKLKDEDARQEYTKKKYISERSHLLQHFRDLALQGFDHLLQWPPYELVYHAGGLMIIPTMYKELEQDYFLDLREPDRLKHVEQAREMLYKVKRNNAYTDQLRILAEKTDDLLRDWQQRPEEITQKLVQRSQYIDQYAALPMLAFLVPEVFKEYFKNHEDDQDPFPFRTILNGLLRSRYSPETLLPIGANYLTHPFLIFRDFNLEENRHRIFGGNSLFASYEMNILNMILSTTSSQ